MPLESSAGLRSTPMAAIDRSAAEAARWLAVVLLAMLSLAAIVLLWRRMAGALATPLEAPPLLGAALAAAGAAAAVRFFWRLPRPPATWPWPDRIMTWAPPVALGAIGAALSLPETSAAGLAAFWLVLAAEEIGSLRPWRRRRQVAAGLRPAPPAPGLFRYDAPQPSPPQPVSLMVVPEEISPEDVVQQLTRSQAPDGSETLSGWLRLEMSAGQRSASHHVAFCPPFAQTPRLAVEQLSGPPARIKTIQLLPYGTRFDVKLDQPSDTSAAVLLRFLARSAPTSSPSTEPGDEGGEP